MKTVRLTLSIAIVIALAGGYAASQYAYFTGQAPDYAKAADTPAVRIACLAVFIAALALVFWPDRTVDR